MCVAGNEAFANAFDPNKWPMGPRCLRIVNAPDVVPKARANPTQQTFTHMHVSVLDHALPRPADLGAELCVRVCNVVA